MRGEGSCPDKAVKKKRSAVTVPRAEHTGDIKEERDAGEVARIFAGRFIFSFRTSVPAAEFTVCLTCFGPLTHVS